jgi:hypothetical protein
MGGMLLAAGSFINPTAAAPPAIANPNNILANPVAPEAAPVPQWQQEQPDEMDVFEPAGQVNQNSVPEIFCYGPFQIRPHADYQVLYGNGIQYAPGNAESTLIQQLSPGILLDLGRHWVLDYTPTFVFYSNKKFQNTTDSSITLNGGFQYEAWKFSLSHSSQLSSAPTVEAGGQTDQDTHSTTFGASRILNSVLSTDLGFNQQIDIISGRQNSYDWSSVDWINYQFWPRLNAGLGAGAGYVLIEGNGSNNGQFGQGITGDTDQTYELAEARVNWRATDKMSLQISAGLQDRQFNTAGASDSVTPIFSASLQYQPAKKTQIALTASRTTASSDYYLAAQETETTIVGVSLNQGLFHQFSLGASIAYSLTDYNAATSSQAANAANRSDNLVLFNIRLSHPFLKRGTWSVFYQYSNDSSSQAGYSFDSNQEGLEISYSF